MRWRFVDRVTAFRPWLSISGLKAVSLEEYYLLEPLGREGVLPESLVAECCVELARWLVIASSSFSQSARLSEIVGFEAHQEVTMGDVIEVQAVLQRRTARTVSVQCTSVTGGMSKASGTLRLVLIPAADALEQDEAEECWRGLYGTS
jgi:hypothetical protein